MSVLVRKINNIDITCLNLAESGGTTDEVAVMATEEQPPVDVNKQQANYVK